MDEFERTEIGAAWAADRLAAVYVEAERMGDRKAMEAAESVKGWFGISEPEWQQALETQRKAQGGA